MSGGETLLNDMQFTYFTRALVGGPSTTVFASNMSTAHFVGITDKLWVPSTLVQFVSELVPVGEEVPQQLFSFVPLEEVDSEFVESEPFASGESDNQSPPEEMPVIEPKEEQSEVEEHSEDSDVDLSEVEEEEVNDEIEGVEAPEDAPEEMVWENDSVVDVEFGEQFLVEGVSLEAPTEENGVQVYGD